MIHDKLFMTIKRIGVKLIKCTEEEQQQRRQQRQ